MATYKGIQGYSVQTLTSDPTAADVEGQLWYNSTSGTYKISVAGTGAWSSGGALTTARNQSAGIGTQTAALCAGGNTPPYTADSETYDGSSWTEGGNLQSARRNAEGTGTTTAGMIVGGDSGDAPIDATEFYDGTSWSTQTGTLTRAGGRQGGGIAGASQSSALYFGGSPSTGYSYDSETWDGTSWSEGNNLTTLRTGATGAGIVTAALCIGGSPIKDQVESYDGTCWTETSTDINTARAAASSSGTSTACLLYGGAVYPPGNMAITESFNGTTWTEIGDMAQARANAAEAQSPAGLNTSALAIGGVTHDHLMTDAVEEFDGAPVTVKTVTTS